MSFDRQILRSEVLKMSLIVQKFGGSSLATINHINHVADLIAKAKQAGHELVVIVSAMQGETDKLINLAKQVHASPNPREYAALLATGEQASMSLIAMALLARDIQAKSYTGWQARIQTNDQFKNARIDAIDTKPILSTLATGAVVVIAGFQGIDNNENITILGRGGSDTTAVAIAAALGADECQIYTDVDGIYTTDPKIVPDAQRLAQVSFEEMLELASLGTKVLQIRAVEFAGKYKIPLRVLSSIHGGPGTLITYQQPKNLATTFVAGIACSRNEGTIAITGIPDTPGIAAHILAELSCLDVNIDMMVQYMAPNNTIDFVFTVALDEHVTTMQHLKKIATSVGASDIKGATGFAKISVVGTGLKNHPEVATQMFRTLATMGINIKLITTSEIKISVLIDADFLEIGTVALHNIFKLSFSTNDDNILLTPKIQSAS